MLASLQRKLDGLDEQVLEDQRMVKAIEKWAACMTEQGYQYEDPEEIDADLLKRFESIVGVGVTAGATVPPDAGTSYDKAALADLQREEVKLAQADRRARSRRSRRSRCRCASSTRRNSRSRTASCSTGEAGGKLRIRERLQDDKLA